MRTFPRLVELSRAARALSVQLRLLTEGKGRCWLPFALLALMIFAAPAAVAQTYTVTAVTPNSPDLGTVIYGTSTTTFTVSASTGSVTGSPLPASGGATRVSSGMTRPMVTISCTGGKTSNSCPNGTATITVTKTGSPTNLAGALTAFTVAAGTGTPTNITGSGTASLSFGLKSIPQGGSQTVYLGMDFPIGTSGTTGTSNSSFIVTVTITGGNSMTGTGTAQVIRPLSVTTGTSLRFGTVSAPQSGFGPGSVSINAQSGARTVADGVTAVSSTFGPAQFTINGEGGQTVSVSASPTFLLTFGTTSLTVATSVWSNSTTLSSALGTAGSVSSYVGGTLSGISSTTPGGTYSGTFTITAAYN